MPPDSKELGKLFEDIVRGFSIGVRGPDTLFIKHFNLEAQRKIEVLEEKIFKRARDQGLPTHKESLEFLNEEGLWTNRDEDKIKEQEAYLSQLETTQRNLLLPSQRDGMEAQLLKGRQGLAKQQRQKAALLRDTCESYARKKINHEMLFYSLYKNEGLEESYLDREEFENLSNLELGDLSHVYNEGTYHLSTKNIKHLGLDPLFVNYYNITADHPAAFFESPLIQWTFYQVNLINYGKIFRNILENVSDIPENIKEDPEGLLEFAQGDNKRREALERSHESDGYSLVGATKEDMKDIGLNQEGGGKTLQQTVKEKGGKMSIEDFADLFGK